jgi:hypothetical protein
MEGFAFSIDVCVDTISDWAKAHPGFFRAYKKAKLLQYKNWQICSLKGLYNPAFTIFFGKNIFKWTDKQDININAKIEAVDCLTVAEREALKQVAKEQKATVLQLPESF